MGVITTGILAATAVGGLGMSAAGMVMGQGDAKTRGIMAETEGILQEAAFKEDARTLANEQRRDRAETQVLLASSGAGSGQTQPLMLLADQANMMQQDQISMFERGGTARRQGKSRSLLAKAEGQRALVSGLGSFAQQAVSTGISAYGLWGGSGGEG